MADDNNIKDLKSSIDAVKGEVAGIKNNLPDKSIIEQSLQSVKNSVKTNASKEDVKQQVEKGVNVVLNKLQALKTIQHWIANEENKNSNGKGINSSIERNIDAIVRHQQNIYSATTAISSSTGKISDTLTAATEYLRVIKEHIINGGSASRGSSNTATAAGATGDTSSIHSTVKAILSEIINISNHLSASTVATEQSELGTLIRKNLLASERVKEKELERSLYIERGEITRKDKSGKRTLSEKEFLRELRQEDREREERKRKINGKAGTDTAVNIGKEVVSAIISEKPTASKLADVGINSVSQISPVVGSIMSLAKAVIGLGSERDRATTTFARTVGGSSTGKYGVGETIRSFFNNKNVNRPELGYEFNEAMSALTEVAEARGRTTERTSARDLASSINLKRAGIGAESINNFDTFGKSLEQTDRYFAKLYGEVSKKGLSFKNVSKAINDNLKQAQSHSFANGLRGLQKMAETSTQLKYNMQQVFTFADKVSDLEGAISTAANLSVLGGQFAQFSNPMQLLYEGLNDTEALNDRIIKMFGNNVYWNQEKGQMDMNNQERYRLKEAAKAAGLDPNEMLNLAYNQGRIRRISSQIGTGVDKDTAEYIKNLGELDENGQAYVSINGERHFLNDAYANEHGERPLTAEDYKELSEESKKKEAEAGATLGNIWSNTNSIFENLDKMLTYLQEKLGNWVFKIFQKYVGGEEANRETVREWALKNGKDETSAIEAYDKHKNDNWWLNAMAAAGLLGPGALLVDTHKSTAKNIGKWENEITPQGKSENGINPNFSVPGKSAFNTITGKFSGASHLKGGIAVNYGGKPWEIQRDESLLNSGATALYGDIVPKMNNYTYNPYSYANDAIKNDMNKLYSSMNVAASNTGASNVGNSALKNGSVSGTIKVDVPQTITLNLAGAGKIGDYDVSGLVKQLVDSMMKEWLMRSNLSGFDKEKFQIKTVI